MNNSPDLISCLKPEDTFLTKIRLGPNEDGGYVVPEIILEKCNYLFTYGVGSDIRYEEDFVEKYGKPAFLFDHTINHINTDHLRQGLKFFPQGLGVNKDNCRDWYENYKELDCTGDILLKIDIEGREYEYFKNTDILQLKENVAGLLLEVHWIDNEQNLKDTIDILNKIKENFILCHIHGNNWGELWDYKGYQLPKVLELTFINKKLVTFTKPNTQSYPIHNLDLPNNPNKEDYKLDFLQADCTEKSKIICSSNTEQDGGLSDTEVVVTLTTIPSRLASNYDCNIKSCLESLLNQTFQNYEVHLNIPYIYNPTGEEYNIPDWLYELADLNHKLKIFRGQDYGSITKIVDTLKRIQDPECIIITADDDLIYHKEMVQEQYKNQRERFNNCAVGYDGMSSLDNVFRDIRNHYVTSVPCNVRVNVLQHYKTVSYKRSYFENDFFEEFIDKSWADDIIVSAYMGKRGITKFVTYYDKEKIPVTLEEWQSFGGVTTFPVISHTQHESEEGCNIKRRGNVSDNFNYFVTLGYLK